MGNVRPIRMTPTDIEATFPQGHRLPCPIVDLCTFLERNGYPISGCFEISKIGIDDLKGWFQNDLSSYEQFLPFGRGACGDVYALWLTDGLSPEQAPVVMFGSEGELEVLASDAEQFCRLLCLGYSEIGLDDPTTKPADFDETEPFRRFMVERYGFEFPATAAPIIDAARTSFPSFKTWVESRQP
jgi:hypothetical protein